MMPRRSVTPDCRARKAGERATSIVPGFVRLLTGALTDTPFDQQSFSAVGSDVRLQSTGYEATAPSYDIEVASSAGVVTIQET